METEDSQETISEECTPASSIRLFTSFLFLFIFMFCSTFFSTKRFLGLHLNRLVDECL